MKIIFFETSSTIHAKNFLPIANYINERQNDFSALFVSAEIASYTNKTLDEESKEKLLCSPNYAFFILKTFNHKKIEAFLKKQKPDFVFIDSYRIIDQLWVGIANKLGVKTYKLQHGFEIDTVHYKYVAIINQFSKCVRMGMASFHLSRFLKVSFASLFSDYFLYIFCGRPLRNSALAREELHPFVTFVYSEYYKMFWNKKFGFSLESMELITPIDFLMINKVREKERVAGCCYIAQTLVEDGRMKRDDFLKLMKQYKETVKGINSFIIKLHPRSDISMYDGFKDMPNVTITRDFPNCAVYLTHYSSLAFTAAFLSNTVILHELDGHPTPKVFKNDAISKIVADTEEIKAILMESTNSIIPELEQRRRELEYYAVFEEIDAYKKVYDRIKADND